MGRRTVDHTGQESVYWTAPGETGTLRFRRARIQRVDTGAVAGAHACRLHYRRFRDCDHSAWRGSSEHIITLKRVQNRSIFALAELERCQSGRSGSPGKRVCPYGYRGFESLPLRINTAALAIWKAIATCKHTPQPRL